MKIGIQVLWFVLRSLYEYWLNLTWKEGTKNKTREHRLDFSVLFYECAKCLPENG